MVEQLRECLQPAGGGSHANNEGRAAFGAILGRWPLDSPRGNGPYGRCGCLPNRGRSPLWAGRVRRTWRTRNPAGPTTAGLLCQTPPFPFSPKRRKQST
jgi:hypothetical protein